MLEQQEGVEAQQGGGSERIEMSKHKHDFLLDNCRLVRVVVPPFVHVYRSNKCFFFLIEIP